ncbi:hypothetical protein RchiOBHm_Chr2g0168141 [Rosa chinensis]|uniref:Uncharacterized protein n=1 Tax=Rosa chinensis TaxID=74649 RepID=A0A2P6S4H4_ROSCH|nr:uncharacterized protein LOC112186758 isoform X2 [Rosa chinensis]PRQ53584.1 hypothetical protein RchiOBHm_Chr2g0168141 [Rosa chinensis]
MQRSIYIVLLPLFLILLFGVSSVPSFHSDIRNSVLSKTTSISNSVMGPKPMFRRTKRDTSEHAIRQRRTKSNCVLFGGHQYDEARSKKSKTMSDVQIAERSNQSGNIDGFEYYDEWFRNQNQNNFCMDDNGRSPSTVVAQGNQYSAINSRRWKTLSQPIMTRENQLGEMSNPNVDIMENRDQQEVVQVTDEYQYSYGQASYQRSKQGSAIAYEDSGISNSETSVRAQFFKSISTQELQHLLKKSSPDFDRKSLE